MYGYTKTAEDFYPEGATAEERAAIDAYLDAESDPIELRERTIRTVAGKFFGRYAVRDISRVLADDPLPTRFAAWVDENVSLNGHVVFAGIAKGTYGYFKVYAVSDTNGDVRDSIWYRA
jgi:hypothetical protein